MNDLDPLTDDEVALIRKRRAEQARLAALQALRLAALDTAARYARWLADQGRGSSFTAEEIT